MGETAADVLPHTQAVEQLLATLYAVLAEADGERAAARLNELLSIWTGPLRLHREGSEPWHLHAEHENADGVAWFASSSLLAMAVQFAERGETAWGVCEAAGCERIYVREGPGRPRSTCSPACATRRRQAEFRARQRGS